MGPNPNSTPALPLQGTAFHGPDPRSPWPSGLATVISSGTGHEGVDTARTCRPAETAGRPHRSQRSEGRRTGGQLEPLGANHILLADLAKRPSTSCRRSCSNRAEEHVPVPSGSTSTASPPRLQHKSRASPSARLPALSASGPSQLGPGLRARARAPPPAQPRGRWVARRRQPRSLRSVLPPLRRDPATTPRAPRGPRGKDCFLSAPLHLIPISPPSRSNLHRDSPAKHVSRRPLEPRTRPPRTASLAQESARSPPLGACDRFPGRFGARSGPASKLTEDLRCDRHHGFHGSDWLRRLPPTPRSSASFPALRFLAPRCRRRLPRRACGRRRWHSPARFRSASSPSCATSSR